MYQVAIWDPKGDIWEGALLEDSAALALLGRGGVALPVDAAAVKDGGLSGYAKRAWGGGWPMDFATPRLCCRIAVGTPAGTGKVIHWAARLLPTQEIARAATAGEMHKYSGSFHLAADSSQVGVQKCSVNNGTAPVTVAQLGQLDRHGGWNVELP